MPLAGFGFEWLQSFPFSIEIDTMFFLPGENSYNTKVIRFALGITFGMAVSQLVIWDASFVVPILMSMLLSGTRIDLKTGVGFVAIIMAGGLLGLLLTATVVHLPVLCLLIVSLLMFRIFYAANKGLAPLAVVMLMMGITAIPMMGMQSNAIALSLVQGLTLSGVVAVVFAMLFFWLLPDSSVQVIPAQVSAVIKSPLKSALVSMLVMLPLIVVFYLYSLTGSILVFVFSAILAQTPDLAAGAKGSAALLIANVSGGVVAIVVFLALVGVPEFVFLCLLMFLVSLLFARKIFSDHPYAGLYSSAFTAVLLLVGSSLGENSADAAENSIKRVAQIMIAAIYIVSAFYVLTRLFSGRGDNSKTEAADSETALITDVG
jgi:hypothetical protein